ncbi:MAG TPA: alpha/beta hydrolase [Allosphingosinicella sp.]|jgi:pimeloyl-ACP methyl ester carboxylesterase
MIRFLLAVLAAYMLVLGAAASAAPIDQGGWNARKQSVRLANGVRLAYVELGDPDGAPLLLLHGYTDTSRSWTQVAPWLLRHRLLVPDQRGHGGSDAPACCYSASVFAEDARLFLDAMKVERAAVAGHSLGSMVAMTLAAEHPERVTRVALIGSTALVPVKRGDWLWTNAHALKAPLDPSSDFLREWHPANQPTPVDKAFAEAAMAEILAIPLHVWRGVMRELAEVPAGRHAADVGAPVLILSGGKDPLFSAEHHAALVKAFPKAESQVFPDLGHNLNWERPADVGPVLARFFAAER